ncbi:hypothetical protein GCM10020358_34640 [Amorphoplanes nipponensis]|uniref:Uncharacterized protein n=1 Tax=Actinoplanes nipponensis TaxID=135950 RepID=A0A919JMI6_9ACTN|nr:hypothetical protein Ani05nite_56160 [Actinoplanes nipponensis]
MRGRQPPVHRRPEAYRTYGAAGGVLSAPEACAGAATVAADKVAATETVTARIRRLVMALPLLKYEDKLFRAP